MIGAPRIVVLGAGPTGLGAAHRLLELGHADFDLYEASDQVGGLARSHLDAAGFTWDMGGHVQFSHYEYFDHLMDSLLPGEWLEHERAASVWIDSRFVPYPFQHHLAHLSEPLASRCRDSLLLAQAAQAAQARRGASGAAPTNFDDWIERELGDEIANVFMRPYNRKVWAYDPRKLSCEWLAERVAKPARAGDERGWGPNRTFRFPARGGTGEVWRRLAARLPAARLHLESRVVAIDAEARQLRFGDGRVTNYDQLISTLPLDQLVAMVGDAGLRDAARSLAHSSVHVIGVGLRGHAPAHLRGRSWMYFPEDDCPFYRATVFSSYAPANVPDPDKFWSLMLEVSESADKPVEEKSIVSDVIAGLVRTRLIESAGDIASTWHTRLGHGYPTPTLGRAAALAAIQPVLERQSIFSRGRFGAWKYEISNQDHSLMQGVEVIDRLLRGGGEPTLYPGK